MTGVQLSSENKMASSSLQISETQVESLTKKVTCQISNCRVEVESLWGFSLIRLRVNRLESTSLFGTRNIISVLIPRFLVIFGPIFSSIKGYNPMITWSIGHLILIA